MGKIFNVIISLSHGCKQQLQLVIFSTLLETLLYHKFVLIFSYNWFCHNSIYFMHLEHYSRKRSVVPTRLQKGSWPPNLGTPPHGE